VGNGSFSVKLKIDLVQQISWAKERIRVRKRKSEAGKNRKPEAGQAGKIAQQVHNKM